MASELHLTAAPIAVGRPIETMRERIDDTEGGSYGDDRQRRSFDR